MTLGKLLRKRFVVTGVALAAVLGGGLATASTASADGRTYGLCSYGTFASVMVWPNQGGFTSFVANPGQCVPIQMNGDQGDIYGIYPDGTWFYIGSDWWPSNIGTGGDMGPGDYYWWQF